MKNKQQFLKELQEFAEEKHLPVEVAIDLMINQPSMIKRPIVEVNNKILLGFKPTDWEIIL